MVAYLLAVDREQRDFVPAEERSSSSAAYRNLADGLYTPVSPAR
jgi:hypothetical protein